VVLLVAVFFGPGAAQASIVGLWKMDEGNGLTAHDSSVNANNGVLDAGGQNQPSSWGVGPLGNPDKAVYFKGFTDRIVVNPVNFSLTGDFTIAMWAKADFLGFYPYLIEMTNDANGGARQWFIQGDSNGGDQMYVFSDVDNNWKRGLGFKVGGGAISDQGWHHYTFTYTKATGNFVAYVDAGLPKASLFIAGSPAMPNFTSILIGGKNQNFTSWEGPISDVLILNNAVSASDVTAIMNQTYPGLQAESAPEPSTFVMAVVGLAGLALAARRKLRW
jgi:hypothetical protein